MVFIWPFSRTAVSGKRLVKSAGSANRLRGLKFILSYTDTKLISTAFKKNPPLQLCHHLLAYWCHKLSFIHYISNNTDLKLLLYICLLNPEKKSRLINQNYNNTGFYICLYLTCTAELYIFIWLWVIIKSPFIWN